LDKVYIGSTNPVKITSVKESFSRVFPGKKFEFTGVSIDSKVGHQPMNDEETLLGARNRAIGLKEKFQDGIFWVGIEGGVELLDDEMYAFAWMYIIGLNGIGKARTASFEIPYPIKHLVIKGYELGVADDMVFNRKNSKQKDGAVGILTGQLINRSQYYEHAMILALIPFKNPELFNSIEPGINQRQ
jgi:inosine/xanthosine triphosphatase